MLGYLRSKWQSLAFRLLFYFLLSVLVLAIIVAASFAKRFKPHFENEILPNVEQYIEYVIADIGLPPNLERAQSLANRLPFEVRIEGQSLSWASSPLVKSIDSYHLEPAPPPYNNVYVGHYRHEDVLVIQKPEYRYLFTLDNNFRQRSERRHWLLFLLIGGVLVLLYFSIRRLFRPLAEMSQQVERIGEGDLDQVIGNKGTGELAVLADGIERMSAQIKSMLESKSALLLAISHELRSPITRMRVNLELLDASDTQRQLVADIREMESLVAAILESERLNNRHAPLNREMTQMEQLVEEVVTIHPESSRINSHLTPITANIDPLRVKLLLKNLIDNACHYSNEQGGPVDVQLDRHGDRLQLRVIDRGTGIAAEEIPRLTEAFYRPDSARQRETGGYGLGLYLCQLISTAHGGEIRIESELGEGTRVVVELPLDNS